MKTKPFQLIVLAIFLVLAVAGVLVFATAGGFGGKTIGAVEIWGPVDQRVMRELISEIQGNQKNFDSVTYKQIDERTYTQTLLEALAAGNGPDLFLLPHDQIVSFQDKVFVIPFESFSERTFKNTFIEGGELYLIKGKSFGGALGLPFMVDPLIMYWNRDIFSGAGLSSAPTTWEQFFSLSERLTKRDDSGNIQKSTVAFGEVSNVTHAKEILSLLMLQAGERIIERGESGAATVVLGNERVQGGSAAEAVLRFYTSFSNPASPVYSWNKSLPSSRDMFLRGDLAVYFGLAGELPLIQAANPNLNFDIAIIPQPENTDRPATFGEMFALAIPRVARDTKTSLQVASILTGKFSITTLANNTGLPPVRRDSIENTSRSSATAPIFLDSALIARAWLDPNPQISDGIFSTMVEDVTSGRARISEAVKVAERELSQAVGTNR